MRDIIKITVDADHYLRCPVDTIARDGEGNVTELEITFPEKLASYWVYLDFKMSNGEKFKSPRLDVEGNKATYTVPPYVLVEGKLKMQVLFQNEHGKIWKSYKKPFNVRPSINAVEDIPDKEDFIAEAQKLLDEIEKGGGGAGAGAEALFVTFTITSTGNREEGYGKATADKTFQECFDAYNKGAHICGSYRIGDEYFWGNCAYGAYDGQEGVMFFHLWDEKGTSVIQIMMWETNDCFVLTESDNDIEGKYGVTTLATAKYVRYELLMHAFEHERLGNTISGIKEDLRENTKAIADLQPVRFTVTKQGNKYVASKTLQELFDSLAENEHRSIICELGDLDLPLTSVYSDSVLLFSAATTIWGSTTVRISNLGQDDVVNVYDDTHSIQINGELWGEDNPNADFTDTINGMIDDKIGKIETDLDSIIALQQSLIGGDGV